MIPLYRKLNYLVSQTAPDYKGTRMRGTFVRLTIGAMIDRTPGFFTSINLKWNKAYPWDISLSHLENGEDKDGMQVMPHIMDVNCQFTPIHNFVPSNELNNAPFIGGQGDLISAPSNPPQSDIGGSNEVVSTAENTSADNEE